MSREEAIKTKEYLEHLIVIIRDGPAKFNASEPVMRHLNCLWSKLNKSYLESATKTANKSEPEPKCHWCKDTGNRFMGNDRYGQKRYAPCSCREKSEPGELHINTDSMSKTVLSVKDGQGTRVGSMAKMIRDCCCEIDRLKAENKRLRGETDCVSKSGGILCIELKDEKEKLERKLKRWLDRNECLVEERNQLKKALKNDSERIIKLIKLQAENKAKDEAHKQEIFELNDKCVAANRNLKEELEAAELEIKRTKAALAIAKDYVEHESTRTSIGQIYDIEQALKGQDETKKANGKI